MDDHNNAALAEKAKERAEKNRLALGNVLEQAFSVVERSYLERLDTLTIKPFSDGKSVTPEQFITLEKNGKLYQLTHLVYQKDEFFLDNLKV